LTRWHQRLAHLLDYVKYYEDWHKILAVRLGLLQEASVRLRGHGDCPIKLTRQLYPALSAITYLVKHGARFDPCYNTLTLQYQGHTVTFKQIYGEDIAYPNHLLSTYVHEEYSFLDVHNKTVVDIGASTGDTPIYFALRGAQEIIAYEANPYLCETLRENTKANKLEDKIIVACAAATLKHQQDNKVTFCINKRWSGISRTPRQSGCLPEEEQVTVPQARLPAADVAKLDCEGCEYDIILNMNKPIYTEIGLEYHGSPKPLIKHLEHLGYRVIIIKRRSHNLGMLHAKLQA